MWRRAGSFVIVLTLLAALPVRAQQPTPIAEAASRAVRASATPEPQRRGPMPRGLMWTGLGLIMAAGPTAMLATLSDCFGPHCDRDRKIAYGVAAGEVAGGLVLLGVANARRPVIAPSLVLTRDGALLQSRIVF
jgi:hypothetical protein